MPSSSKDIRSIHHILLTVLLALGIVLAEPIQYCKTSPSQHPNEFIDFCLGISSYHNITTNADDMYLTFTHTRRNGSSLGWTSVGFGNIMAGSLMFIVYGDPLSGEPPVVSIRTATGHVQPTLLTQADMAESNLHVIRAQWLPSLEPYTTNMPDYIATVNLICYSCNKWPGTEISTNTASQPWIWAWHRRQVFPVYSFGAHLDMHVHHAGMGGWGQFYMDMARSMGSGSFAPSMPPIRPNVAALGASDTPISSPSSKPVRPWITPGTAWRAHGLLMALAFMGLFPAGTIAMRSGSGKAFKYHWVVQLIASICVLGGVIVGLVQSHGLTTVHQVMGCVIAVTIFAQGILGWRHHMDFLRIQRRTWISHAHIWTGRTVLLFGMCNLVTGLMLSGYARLCVIIVAVMTATELLGVSVWVWWAATRDFKKKIQSETTEAWMKQQDSYFAIHNDDDDDDDDDSRSGRLEDEKKDKRTLLASSAP